MQDVFVITGGGSGMGLEMAKLLGKKGKVFITGRTQEKLEKAVDELKELGIEAEYEVVDVTDKEGIESFAKKVSEEGNIKNLVNAAGVASTAEAKKIFHINAIGTKYVNEAFSKYMTEGSVILNFASIAGHMVPDEVKARDIYEQVCEDEDRFLEAINSMIDGFGEDKEARGMAYNISKEFVRYWTRRQSLEYGKKGIRVVAIAPGVIDTPMVAAEESSDPQKIAEATPMKRMAKPEEIAKMMEFMLSDEASYLTGVDIIYDGGALAALEFGAVSLEKY